MKDQLVAGCMGVPSTVHGSRGWLSSSQRLNGSVFLNFLNFF